MEIIIKYRTLVFYYYHSNKLASRRPNELRFLQNHTGSRKDFMEYYNKLYPNAPKQIFLDKTHPLSRRIRDEIESTPQFVQLIRNEKLKDILF